jgi:perosamine synthetase
VAQKMSKSAYAIPLIKPYITERVKAKVCDVLDSGHLTEGPVTREFEKTFETYIGCRHAIAVTSCTTGLEMALRALKIGPGDEVIAPDYTYPATANVVAIVGAKIVLVDIDPQSMLIDYDAIEDAMTERTKAVIPVSLFGNPLNYTRLAKIKNRYGVFIIEDAACAIGAEYKGDKVGIQADFSIFSLHPRKFITTGEGGMITTNDGKSADWMLSYKHFGMGVHNSRVTTTFERTGTNYKMSDLLAAVGLVQMQDVEYLLKRRRDRAQTYIELLHDLPDVSLPTTTSNGIHSYQSFCIFVENRDEILRRMRELGVEVQIGSYALHTHPAFKPSAHCEIYGDMRSSNYAFAHCLALPLYHDMTIEEQKIVVSTLKNFV